MVGSDVPNPKLAIATVQVRTTVDGKARIGCLQWETDVNSQKEQ
jgi:hypothetical protein